MVSGKPDYTRSVSIVAYEITSLPVDIVAQTIGDITIDIAAQSMGDIDVNIAASAVTLDINIAASAVTLDINIAAQGVNLNVKTDTGEHVDTDIISSITLDVDITAQTIGNISIDIAAQSVGNLDINIAASAISINVKTTTGEHVDTDIVSSITLDVDITAQTVGNIGVDVAAQSVGNISIDIAAQSVGDLDININAQTAAINIDTAGGTNIVIDKLTQAAYTESRRVLTNQGTTASWTSPTGDDRSGKLFPRGCRGFLYRIGVRCRDTGASGGTISVYIAPYVGAGYLHTADITVPAGGSSALRYATFNEMWNYDMLFIFVKASQAEIEIAYDTGTPYDSYGSSDAGATWTTSNSRFWFAPYIRAQNVGDLPVSGTLNTIEIPTGSSEKDSGSVSVTQSVHTTVLTVHGMGFCDLMRMTVEAIAQSAVTRFDIVCDGTTAWSQSPSDLNTFGCTASTPGMSLTAYGAGAECTIVLTKRFHFRRLFEIKVLNTMSDVDVKVVGPIDLVK